MLIEVEIPVRFELKLKRRYLGVEAEANERGLELAVKVNEAFVELLARLARDGIMARGTYTVAGETAELR